MIIDEGFTGQVSMVLIVNFILKTNGCQTYVNALYMYWGLLDVYGAADEYCQNWMRQVMGWMIFQ